MKISVIGILLLVFIGCGRAQSVSITEFDQKGMNNYTLLDVRTPEEYAAGHLENAINLNWYDADFATQLKSLPKENTFYVYCKKGGRSANAFALMDSLGYKVVNLEGGYDAYLTHKKE